MEAPALIDLYASLPHYAAHMAPVWDQLARIDRQGFAYGPKGTEPWVNAPVPFRERLGAFLVAGYADAQHLGPRPVILLEHGAGQHYAGLDLGSYAGGKGWDRAVLFLSPNEVVAERWRATYPSTPTVVVGCPRLDRFAGRKVPTSRATVAVTFHWLNHYCPESLSALPHYQDWLPQLAAWARSAGVRLIGHGHPRLWGSIERRWAELGVEREPDLERVLEQADVFVCDSTSAGYEAAAVGIPTVWLNAPTWRRDVHHGLRFWSDVPGPQADSPSEVIPLIEAQLADPAPWEAERQRVTALVYGELDGRASERAAGAIAAVLA